MEAGCCCEIVADDTQALDVDWGKFHNPLEHAWPYQVKRWGEGPHQDPFPCAQVKVPPF